MADPVLDAIDRKKQVLSSVEYGLKTATETVVPFVKEDIIDPLADTFWGRVAKNAAVAGLEFLDPVLSQFDRPQNALQGYITEGTEGLKRGWSQEQDYSFSEAIPEDFKQQYPYISGALGGTADFLGDPTMLVGGMLTKGAQKIIPNSAMKGNWAAGSPNYIDNFYGNDNPDLKANALSKTIGKQLIKRKGGNVTDKNVEMAAKKVGGLTNWGLTSAGNMINDLLNPYARALYGETGINRSSQARVQNLVEKGSKRDVEKAIAQGIYNTYIPQQARRTGNLAPELREIQNYSNVFDSNKLDLDSFKEGAKETSFVLKTKDPETGKTKTTEVKTPERDIDFAYDRIIQAWGVDPNNTSLTFKRPSGSSGNHLSDLSFKNKANSSIRNVLLKFEQRGVEPTIEELFTSFEREGKKKSTPFKLVNPDVEHAKKNGLWIQGSMVGNAVVEGGVNVLTKVLPNGRTISFISDVHDFLEKTPVLGPKLGQLLPETKLAVVGPLHLDVMGTDWAKNSRKTLGIEEPIRDEIVPVKDKGRQNAREVLQNYANVRPSNLGVAAETAKLAGRGMLTGSLAQNLQDTFQEPQ